MSYLIVFVSSGHGGSPRHGVNDYASNNQSRSALAYTYFCFLF